MGHPPSLRRCDRRAGMMNRYWTGLQDYFWYCKTCKLWQTAMLIIKHGRQQHEIDGAEVS